MCKFCSVSFANVKYACEEYLIYKLFELKNDETKKSYNTDGNEPVMYLREYRQDKKWSVVCEFADNDGRVVETPVYFYKKCGRKLKDENKQGDENGRKR